jgi:hypothetical protein
VKKIYALVIIYIYLLKIEKNRNFVLEDYGLNSKCFLHNRTWHIYSDGCQSRITVSKTVGCYNVSIKINFYFDYRLHNTYFFRLFLFFKVLM